MTLTIDEFVKGDVGLYTCVSTNSLGLKESDVRVYGEYIHGSQYLIYAKPTDFPIGISQTVSKFFKTSNRNSIRKKKTASHDVFCLSSINYRFKKRKNNLFLFLDENADP